MDTYAEVILNISYLEGMHKSKKTSNTNESRRDTENINSVVAHCLLIFIFSFFQKSRTSEYYTQ